eukprot:TRINITY_DN111_c0_g2_i1.p1 TRINITY_DN111_c0_g2~~TRINITY_DN111_c0_g2_i1.p1  ORF type:complete len:1074 (-),score=258.07 TRINITY_DN111_c0_g2_i1:52-3033(-)
MDANAVQVMELFLIERLQDYATQHEVLDAMRALVLHHKFPEKESAKKLATAILNNERVHAQSMPQSVRKLIFETVEGLVDSYPAGIAELKSDFVFGFIQAMDGEKDPRNLLICFRTVPKIVRLIPEYLRFEEDLFDITSCYFPITFTEKKGDPHAVKKADLINGLRSTMIAAPKMWIRFLMEKLTSNLVETKAEVLESIQYAVSTNPPLWNYEEHMKELLPEMQEHLNIEIMQSTDPNIPTAALALITDLTQYVARSNPGNDAPLEAFLAPLEKMTLRHFQEKQDGKLATQSAKILTAAAAATYESATHIFKIALRPLKERYFNESDQGHRENLLRMLINFAKATAHFDDPNREHPLSPFQAKLYAALQAAISTSTSDQEVIEAIEGVAIVANLRKGQFLDAQRIVETIALMIQVLLTRNTPNASVHLAALTALTALAIRHPQLALQHAIKPLFEKLHQFIEEMINPPEGAMDWQPTSGSSSVAPVRTKIEDLISWLHTLCEPSSLKTLQGPGAVIQKLEADPLVVSAVHEGFINILSKYFSNEHIASSILSSLAKTVSTQSAFLRVFAVIVNGFASNSSQASDATNNALKAVYRWMPDLSAHAVQAMNPADQHTLVKQMFNGFNTGSLEAVLANAGIAPQAPTPFKPFASDAPELQRHLVPIFAAVVSSSAIDTFAKQLPDSSAEEEIFGLYKTIARNLFSVIARPASGTSGLDIREQDIICTAIGAIVNKLPDGPLLNELVQQLLVEQMADPVAQQRLLAWVIKASIQRGLSIADSLFDNLLNALIENGDGRAPAAAAQFKIFFSDNQQLPLRKPLYKQKYFTKALNRLVPLFSNRDTSDAQRSIILTALGGLLKGLPQGALINSASTVVPLLLQALNSPDSSLRHETLTTFHLLMETDSNLLEQHLESLVPALLRISSDGTTTLPDTRKAALDCLLLFTKFPYHKIHPFKDRVVAGLKKALDDKKRQVRKAAVVCRNEWIVLTATPQAKT